ncbi:hypothetical protein OGAPHI_007153 [Ogataea philodendri]|uniref:Uncharacterized protein n=1 Tax=Ogataea philodendri TaxID=1378263 RepID=A0A9P8NWN2_9ASCO|nr:uncharacterized protein OGAPHI_007153 [Ogataea philodendri]KAH3660567.1 hypothetical protein OGAPHI_007153 [Ogataea philodendri]
MGQDLRGKHRDVVASVGLSSNVEVVFQQVWELLVEQFEECIHILTGCNGVGHRLGGVRESDIDWLVKEHNGCVGVPRVLVVDWLEVWTDGGGSQFEEQTGQGRTTWTSVKPENHWVVLRIVSGLKGPVEKVLVFIFHIQVSRILLGVVDSQVTRVGFLDSQLVIGQFVVLNVSVPESGWLLGDLETRFRLDCHALDSIRELHFHFSPQFLHLGSQTFGGLAKSLRNSVKERFPLVQKLLGNGEVQLQRLLSQGVSIDGKSLAVSNAQTHQSQKWQ